MIFINREEFKRCLHLICTKETSSDPKRWTPENPLCGHCVPVALLAQNEFGGNFLRTFLDDTTFAHMNSHYWNILNDGTELDFTIEQFGNTRLNLKGTALRSNGSTITRRYLLSSANVMQRYLLLSSKFSLYFAENTHKSRQFV